MEIIKDAARREGYTPGSVFSQEDDVLYFQFFQNLCRNLFRFQRIPFQHRVIADAVEILFFRTEIQNLDR